MFTIHEEKILAMLEVQSVRRCKDFLRSGIPFEALKTMRNSGKIDLIHYGIYCLRRPGEPRSNYKAAELAIRYPDGILCLGGALIFHSLVDERLAHWTLGFTGTTCRPTAPDGTRMHHWQGRYNYGYGVEERVVLGVRVRFTSKPRTVADLFRFESKVPRFLAYQALSAFLSDGGRPEEVAEIAQEWGFYKRIEHLIEFSQQLLSDGAIAERAQMLI
ncbi:hypothetical protein ABUK73_15180 [Agrobacterium sp. BA1120]|uniref:type IV toxin-antitoxin system AbiEi family antitoxin domain-containing protein n=1 Tax=Agrobacterium sp. BA1120 TaxID=3228927 RepID=UPI00336AB5F7